MTKAGKVIFLFALLAFVLLGVSRLVYGGWHSSFWLPLGMFLGLFVLGVVKEWRILKEVAFMRSTKYGMNTGIQVLITMSALICVNILANRYEKKMDLSQERYNSLSDQSFKIATAVKVETELVLLLGKDAGQVENLQRSVRDLMDMYRNVNSKIKFVTYDVLVRPDIAQKFEFTFGPYAVYVAQGERRLKVDPPTEESVTRALMKLAREKKKKIYFTRGHGELLLEEKAARGMSILKDNLSVSYEVKSFALFENKNKVPDDADVVAVVGPMQQFLPEEIQALREYTRSGGHLFLALDPGSKQNLAQLTKSFGVEFANDFVLDLRSQARKGAPSLVLGTEFSATSEVTRAFRSAGNEIALFQLASSLRKAPEAVATLKIESLVQTDASTANIPELKEKIEFKPNGPHIVGMAVKGKDVGAGESAKEFSVVIFGDSDFLGNQLIHNNLNRDLVENSFAWLAADTELISIRPKEPKGTKLMIMDSSRIALTLALFGITLVLMSMSIGFWWRRRMA
jgi:ABC-type uncharacterized transport system involved in gliding motility auxiliary subunit